MNKVLLQPQTDLQEQKNKNIPAPLLLGPSHNELVEESLKTIKADHLKVVADLNAKLLQTRVSANAEHRDEKSKMQSELDGLNVKTKD